VTLYFRHFYFRVPLSYWYSELGNTSKIRLSVRVLSPVHFFLETEPTQFNTFVGCSVVEIINHYIVIARVYTFPSKTSTMMNSIRCLPHRQGSMRSLRNASQRYLSAPAAATHLNGYVNSLGSSSQTHLVALYFIPS
jgi:hypothetical protein